MSRGILLSSIVSIDLFIIFSRKIAEYAHIWLRLIIEIVTLPANFSQATGKSLRVHESSNVECCLLHTQWSGTSMELGLVIGTHNTPGLTRQIAIKSPQSTDLHRWYSTHCGLNALHYYYQHIETGIKWHLFCRRHFQCFFLNKNCSDHNFTQIWTQGPS